MASTAIPTIFLDRELCITRYTPSAVGLFRIIPSDLGRPLFDLQHQLDYPELKADAERVLEGLVPVEHEVSSSDGRWFLARLLPYRTLEDQIAGLLLTLVNITVNKQAEQALQAAHARTKSILENTTDCFYALDRDWRFTYVNSRTEACLGMAKEQILGTCTLMCCPRCVDTKFSFANNRRWPKADRIILSSSPRLPARGLSSTSFPVKMA